MRGSILYGAEAMINMKECNFRKIEQIKEHQIRPFFSEDQMCPIHLLYLESGETPARFEIQGMIIFCFLLIFLQQKKKTPFYIEYYQLKKKTL